MLFSGKHDAQRRRCLFSIESIIQRQLVRPVRIKKQPQEDARITNERTVISTSVDSTNSFDDSSEASIEYDRVFPEKVITLCYQFEFHSVFFRSEFEREH